MLAGDKGTQDAGTGASPAPEWTQDRGQTLGFREEDASDVVVTAGVICIWEARLFQTSPPRQTVIPDRLPACVESTLLLSCLVPHTPRPGPCCKSCLSADPVVIPIPWQLTREQALLPHGLPLLDWHTRFSQDGFLWFGFFFFFFLHKFAAASFETTSAEATQSDREQEEKKKEKEGKHIKGGQAIFL